MDDVVETVTGGLVLKGVLAILFGIAAVFWPGITLITLIYVFSAFILLSGIVTLISAFVQLFRSGIGVMSRILSLILGALEIGVGVYLLRHVHVGFKTLILLIGFILIIRGVLEVIEAIFEDRTAGYRVLMVVVGLLAVLAGIIMLFQPIASGVAFVWILGIYGLIAGCMLLAGAVEVNRVANRVEPRRRA